MQPIVFKIVMVAIMSAFARGTAAPETVPTATSWFKYSYWTDILCTQYAGEYATGLNVCYSTEYGHVIYSYVTEGVSTVALKSQFYSDSSCLIPSFNTTVYYSTSCTSGGPGYYVSVSNVPAPTTSFPDSGLLTSVYDTNADCNSQIGEMAYLFQTFDSPICYPWVNGAYLTASSCDVSYYSRSNTTCANPGSNTLNSPTTYSCTSIAGSTTEGGLIGYYSASCVVNPTLSPSFAPGESAAPSYSRVPTPAPTVTPTPADNTQYLQFNYWSDSACTVFAGMQGGLGNTCIQLYNGYYSNSTVTYSFGTYIVKTYIYLTYGCGGSTNTYYTSQYSAACTLDTSGDFYYTTEIVSSVPTSFPKNGALTNLYATQNSCYENEDIVWYMYQVYGTGICYEYLNNYYTSTDKCGEESICGTDDTMSVSVNTCPATVSFADVTSALGYAEITCFGSDATDDDSTTSGLSPGTIAAIVVPVVAVTLLGAAAAAYYFLVMVPASSLTAPLVTGAANTA